MLFETSGAPFERLMNKLWYQVTLVYLNDGNLFQKGPEILNNSSQVLCLAHYEYTF